MIRWEIYSSDAGRKSGKKVYFLPMENKQDSPGVYIPPPLFYAATFFAAAFIQKQVPVDDTVFHMPIMKAAGVLLLVIAPWFLVSSLRMFLKSKNTLVPIKPATSLQTTGIYRISRNPMYTGLAIVYLGISCLLGNWWHFILFPLLLFILYAYVIVPEEKYLTRRFGQSYLDYRLKVRRWL